MDGTPRIAGDSSLAFMREGYLFGHRRFEAFGSDAFRTRLGGGRRVLFVRGSQAAQFFYGDDRFTRARAMPTSVVRSLQDEESVQTLAGAPHHARKALFLDALGPQDQVALATRFGELWDAAAARRAPGERISVLDAASELLSHATLDWLRVPATSDIVRARAREMSAMIDGAGSFAWRNWRGRTLRLRSEAWARDVVRRARASRSSPSRPLALLVSPESGLDDDTAAVELLNLLRPTVAVARFIAFAALALHRRPEWLDLLRADDRLIEPFAEEVRRTTPLFPVIGGTAARDLTWRGIEIGEGDWVILDLFATDRHPREWEHAWRFDPRRHLTAPPSRSGFRETTRLGHPHVVAQGAGPMATGHRCPGEPATRRLLVVAVGKLATSAWTVPRQNLRVSLSRFPAQPGRQGMAIHWGPG